MYEKFENLAKQLQLTSRVGDLVKVTAPAGSFATAFNGLTGELCEFCAGGWVVVSLDGVNNRRFRADELLVL